MAKALTLEELNLRFETSFEQKVIATKYINRRSLMDLQCLDCGHTWSQPASSVIIPGPHKCPNCGVVKKVTIECAYCGKECEKLPSRVAKKQGYLYCSKECGNRHKNQIRFLSGEWDDSTNYRLKAFTHLEHRCFICGWAEDERILEVHHIDENRSNNKLDNLMILCPICHRKITLGYYYLQDNQLVEK